MYQDGHQREGDALLHKVHNEVVDGPKSDRKEPDPLELLTQAVQTSLNAVARNDIEKKGALNCTYWTELM